MDAQKLLINAMGPVIFLILVAVCAGLVVLGVLGVNYAKNRMDDRFEFRAREPMAVQGKVISSNAWVFAGKYSDT